MSGPVATFLFLWINFHTMNLPLMKAKLSRISSDIHLRTACWPLHNLWSHKPHLPFLWYRCESLVLSYVLLLPTS